MAVVLRIVHLTVTSIPYPEQSQVQSHDREVADFLGRRRDQRPLQHQGQRQRPEDHKTSSLPASMAPCYCRLKTLMQRHSSPRLREKKMPVLLQVSHVLFFERKKRRHKGLKAPTLLR